MINNTDKIHRVVKIADKDMIEIVINVDVDIRVLIRNDVLD